MATRVLVLGAGFGGMELAAVLSEEVPDDVEVTVIDRADAFVFGYAKLDVLFGRTTLDAVRLPYDAFDRPSVRLLRETVTAIHPERRRVVTDAGAHEGDVLVIALGAEYVPDATPGLVEHGSEFYSVEGAARLAPVLADARPGNYVVGVCDAPFKCPPAPSECALLLHDLLRERGIREQSTITFTIPLPSAVPPSPDASAALLEAFAERDIRFVPGVRPTALDGSRVRYDDGSTLPYDLFLGVPKHRAPRVVLESGLAEDGYVPVDSATLRTRAEGVYAIGDVATAGVPKAGVFAEGAGRVVARRIVAGIRGEAGPEPYDGIGECYVEFGDGRVGVVTVDFLSGPSPTGALRAPSADLVVEKERFGAVRRARWFGR